MKKRSLMIAAAAAFILAMTGCNAETTENVMAISVEDNIAELTLDNSEKDDSVSAGALVVTEGQEVVIEPALEGDSKINIKLAPTPEEQNIDEPEEGELPKFGDPELDIDVTGSDPIECSVKPGSYEVIATSVTKSTGSVTIKVTDPDGGPYADWTKADSIDAAAVGAGLNGFTLPMDAETDLGPVSASKDFMNFRYKDGVVQADFPMAAAGLVVRKGKIASSGEDISDDTTSYAHEWTQDVNGTQVKCFGNREGAAMKSIWTSGDYSYSLSARGEGGEDDFGLSAADVTTWVAGIK